MADIHTVLPSFDTGPFDHLFPSLDRHGFRLSDLLAFDLNVIAKPTQLPIVELRRLQYAVRNALLSDMGCGVEEELGPSRDVAQEPNLTSDSHDWRRPLRNPVSDNLQKSSWNFITTLDPGLDEALGGGIPTGNVVEITGERLVSPGRIIGSVPYLHRLVPPRRPCFFCIYYLASSWHRP
jgi:DNA repair protein RAD57